MILLRVALASILLFLLPLASANADSAVPAKPLRICMFSGAAEYHSDQTLAAFKDYLEGRFNVQCTLNKVTDIHSLPGVDQLETCDVMVVFTRRVELPPDQLEKVRRYLDSGKPVIGIRTASHAFQTWLEFDHEVLGGDYHNHDKADEPATLAINPKAADHPVMTGVKPFPTIGKLYRNPQIASDVTVLLTAATKDDTQPVAWVRTRPAQHDQRVFYTSLGTPEDFENENFRRLISNAIFWTGRVDPVEKPAPKVGKQP